MRDSNCYVLSYRDYRLYGVPAKLVSAREGSEPVMVPFSSATDPLLAITSHYGIFKPDGSLDVLEQRVETYDVPCLPGPATLEAMSRTESTRFGFSRAEVVFSHRNQEMLRYYDERSVDEDLLGELVPICSTVFSATRVDVDERGNWRYVL